MGFVSEVLKDIEGIQWYYIIGIFIFIFLFIAILYRTINTPQKDLLEYKNSIFDDGTTINQSNNNSKR
jgi:hypothetical protein